MFRTALVLFTILLVVSAATISAHVIKGLAFPTAATAFASSPTSGSDAPVPIRWGALDSGLRVVCLNVANTSPARDDRPDWPRITGAGFELPGTPSGFALLEPLDGSWEIVEDVRVSPEGHDDVTLDFALVATERHNGRRRDREPLGIAPGQTAARGSGTRFCVSGPFPDQLTPGVPTTIEQILNGVVVQFQRLDTNHGGRDLGVWDNPARIIPLYPE
jgi:hypothetical protein